MNAEQHRPKRSLGQNFLIDQRVVSKIVDALDVDASDHVIEIGPGRGALTERLAGSGAFVTVIELDRHLAGELKGRYKDISRFQCIEASVLDVDLSRISSAGTTKLLGNLPYNISTPILQKLASEAKPFERVIVMVQREVAARMTANAGDSERGFLTVMLEQAFTMRRLFDVAPAAFRPIPKVWSAVVEMIPTRSEFASHQEFRNLVSGAFLQKRKTLVNNLKARYPDIANVLAELGIDQMIRAESLTASQWRALFACLHVGAEPNFRA